MTATMPLPAKWALICRMDRTLANKIQGQDFFLSIEDCAALEKIDRLLQVLVRCGNGRFVCAVQDVKHFIHIINEHRQKVFGDDIMKGGDYVRDVSLPV